ncbi:MAG TPA: O-antigen ligase family protein [Dissulfurispiraceae bacterium]|nr:O-antigen ligase family protein [Dissulfurispiraceae bacterium]
MIAWMTGKDGTLPDRTLVTGMELGTYVFTLLMFAGAFGTIREAGLYLPPVLWLIRCGLRRTIDLNWREPLFVCLIALSVSGLLSSFLAHGVWQALFLFKREYLKMILLYCVISTVFTPVRRLESLCRFLAFAGLPYLLYAAYTLTVNLVQTGTTVYLETRYFATIIIFFLPFFLLQGTTAPMGRWMVWKIPVVVSFIELIVIGVRGSWLAAATILAIWRLSWKNPRHRWSGRRAIIAVVVVLLGVIVVFLLFPSQFQLIREHTFAVIQMSLRLEGWEVFVAMALDQPLFGHGLDDTSMSARFKEVYREMKGTEVPPLVPTTPHSQFLKIFYQQGLSGLLLYLSLILLFVWRLISTAARRTGASLGIVAALIAGCLGEYALHCLIEDRSLIPLGVLLGMAGAFIGPGRKR